MKILNKSIILKEQNFTSRIFYSSLFFVIGVIITISPLIYLKTLNLNSIIGIAVCFVCFGIPFGYFWGLRSLIPTLQERKALINGNFKIAIDIAQSIYMRQEGIRTDVGDYYCQISFKNYSKITGKYYTISRRLYNKTKEGERFFLVYIGDISKTISIFPKKKFELDDELKQHLIEE